MSTYNTYSLEERVFLIFRGLVRDMPHLSTKELLQLAKERDNKTNPRSRSDIIKNIAIPFTLSFFSITEKEWNLNTAHGGNRNVAKGKMFLAYALLKENIINQITLKEIGGYVGKTHSNIINYKKVMNNYIYIYPSIKKEYEVFVDGLKKSIKQYHVINDGEYEAKTKYKTLLNKEIQVLGLGSNKFGYLWFNTQDLEKILPINANITNDNLRYILNTLSKKGYASTKRIGRERKFKIKPEGHAIAQKYANSAQ